MSTRNLPNTTGTLTSPGAPLVHQGPDERLEMNKYHVLLVIERLLGKSKWPSFGDVLIPFALFLGTLLTLLPSDFQDFGNIKASVWEAFTFLVTVASGLTTGVLLILWLRNRSKYPPKTAEQIVEDICGQMARDRERATQVSRNTTEPAGPV